MKTLKEVLNESGISFSHVARMNNISTQAVNQYRDYPAIIGSTIACAYIKILKDVSEEIFYNESGRVITTVKYIWVREFSL